MLGDSFNCIIMGAAGRDFHDFQTFFRRHPQFRVRAFTATQIPFIAERVFPKSLAGDAYDADIPICGEERLPELIAELDIDFVFLSYSDLPHADVMHKASLVQACGASFALLGPRHTQLESSKPVVAVTAVRTGAGKSPLSQWLAQWMVEAGMRPGVLRHPMPYGDLARQAVERFATPEDLDRFDCTIEEREEYEPYIERGLVIYAGVDYARILEAAQRESDVILWDGGNNDYPFVRTDLLIVVADALRAGHELAYYPGETNFRRADVLVLNKVSQAGDDDLQQVRDHARVHNPSAAVIESDLEVDVDDSEAIAGRRVLVVEDGPTLTHGGMSYGAGMMAARQFGAAAIVDPRPHAVGTIAEAFGRFPHLGKVLPALGYSEEQCRELEDTIRASGAEVIVDASPARLDRLIEIDQPVARVGYQFVQRRGEPLWELVAAAIENCQ